MLVEYFRSASGKPRGVLMAFTHDCDPHRYLVGWALCSKRDKFNKDLGLSMAQDRAMVWSVRNKFDVKKVPNSMHKHLTEFLKRCDSYFKGKSNPFVP